MLKINHHPDHASTELSTSLDLIWLSIDPMSDKYPFINQSTYCSNNPLSRIDLDEKWDIEIHAYKDRSKSGYALMIAKDRNGNEVYRTVVKTNGIGGRTSDVENSYTPQGKNKIVGYRKTGKGTYYNRVSFGPNDILALNYLDGEGGERNGMHIHGGRQEGKYKGRTDLASTHGYMRINDDDMLQLKKITYALEQNDPLEKKGYLTLKDDLFSPLQYNGNRHNAGKKYQFLF